MNHYGDGQVVSAAQFSEGMVLMDNLLYYGDNLDILRRYLKEETNKGLSFTQR